MPITYEEKQKLEALFRRRSWALERHNQELKAEIGQRNPSHAVSRHGFQTGWESQLVRLMTGEAPDQQFAPDGVRGSLQSWETSTGETKTLPQPTRNLNWAAADSTGAFLGPEVESICINLARAKTKKLHTYDEAEVTLKNAQEWREFRYSVAIVTPPYALCGISFVRDKSKPKVEKEVFERLMKQFVAGELLVGSKNASLWDEMKLGEYHEGKITDLPTKTRNVTRMAQFDDFMDLLHVNATWMKQARVVFRRYGTVWRIHTAFAVNAPDAYGPDLPGKWTGNVRNKNSGAVIKLPKT